MVKIFFWKGTNYDHYHMVGLKQVMFGTDFPYPTDIPGLLKRASALPKDQSNALLSGNAMRVFNL